MIPVLVAQFLSALADNILLFVIIGLIKQQASPDWVVPVLQQTFIIAYIVLAPFVGTIADGFSKSRVMLVANSLKCLAVIGLFMGVNPYLTYGLVGVGACLYSPAKYGILKEIKGERFLVKANAMIEGSTISAILLGVVLGGVFADMAVKYQQFDLVIIGISGIYFMASMCNLFIPKIVPTKRNTYRVSVLMRNFIDDFKILWSDHSSRLTLVGTGLFFGVGATIRFLLIAWVPVALGIMDNKTPAYLNAVVAIGIIIGSVLAAKIPMKQAYRVISAGVGMGIGVVFLSLSSGLYSVCFWLVLSGICGGLFLVPLNALLQKQGHKLVGGGHAVAIQNFIENSTMLIMLCIYMGLFFTGVSVIVVGYLFGGFVVFLMVILRFYAGRYEKLGLLK